MLHWLIICIQISWHNHPPMVGFHVSHCSAAACQNHMIISLSGAALGGMWRLGPFFFFSSRAAAGRMHALDWCWGPAGPGCMAAPVFKISAKFRPPPKFVNFGNNNLKIFKSIFKNSLKMNFGRNFAKFGDFGHVRNFSTNEIQNPGANTCHTMRVWFHSKEQRSQISTSTQRRKVPSGVEVLVIQISTRYCPIS